MSLTIRPQHRAIGAPEYVAADQHRLPQRLGCIQSRLHPAHRGRHQHGARRALDRHPARRQRAAVQEQSAALSSWNGQSTLYDGMERLGLAVNGADNASSAATAIGELQQALQIYSASPSNRNLAENARRRGAPGGAHAEQRHAGDPDLPRRHGFGDRAPRSASSTTCSPQFKDANTDIVVRHAQRPRRLRFARPARRDC